MDVDQNYVTFNIFYVINNYHFLCMTFVRKKTISVF